MFQKGIGIFKDLSRHQIHHAAILYIQTNEGLTLACISGGPSVWDPWAGLSSRRPVPASCRPPCPRSCCSGSPRGWRRSGPGRSFSKCTETEILTIVHGQLDTWWSFFLVSVRLSFSKVFFFYKNPQVPNSEISKVQTLSALLELKDDIHDFESRHFSSFSK